MVILPSTRTETGVTVTPSDPRCMAIAEKYGDAAGFFMAIANTQPAADNPPLVLVMKTYGLESVVSHLKMRMKMSVLIMDDSMLNDEEMTFVANSIANDSMARMLDYTLVLDFFRRLEGGEFELYACRPRHIMAAWNKYATAAHQRQDRIKAAAEHEQREAEQARHDAEYLRPDEFRLWKEKWLKQTKP